MDMEYFTSLNHYTDEEFLTQFPGVKKGVFTYFKKALKNAGYLKPREKLCDLHVTIFDDVVSLKGPKYQNWEDAYKYVIEAYHKYLDEYQQYKTA